MSIRKWFLFYSNRSWWKWQMHLIYWTVPGFLAVTELWKCTYHYWIVQIQLLRFEFKQLSISHLYSNRFVNENNMSCLSNLRKEASDFKCVSTEMMRLTWELCMLWCLYHSPSCTPFWNYRWVVGLVKCSSKKLLRWFWHVFLFWSPISYIKHQDSRWSYLFVAQKKLNSCVLRNFSPSQINI